MDYNKLKFFVSVAEKESISKAAKSLQRTQTAINEQVKKLEEELQTKLFERIGKQIVLTPEGKQIFELAQEKLGAIDEQVEWVISKGKTLKGLIRLGYTDDHATSFPLFALLGNFRKKNPSIQFEVVVEKSSRIEEMLLDNSLDLGILSFIKSRDEFALHDLEIVQLILVTTKIYLDKKGPFQSLDQLLEGDLVDFDVNFSCLRLWMKGGFSKRIPDLVHLTPFVTVPNFLAAKEVVGSGHGIALLPRYLVKKELERGDMVRVLPQTDEVTLWLDLAAKKTKKSTLHEQAFIDFLKRKPKV